MSRRGGGGGGRTLKRKEMSDDDPWEPVPRASSSSSTTRPSRSSRASAGSPSPSTSSRSPSSSSRSVIDVSGDGDDVDDAGDSAYRSDDDVDESDVDVDRRMADIDSDEDATASSELPASRDFSLLPLKADHERRPIWVCPNGRVFLDTSSAIYRQAYDFLIAISDPVCRPQFIHEYQITSYSLYAAASLGLLTEDILSGLSRLSKVQLSAELVSFVREKTEKCGKVKLLLNKTRYFVESIYPDVLHELLKQPTIKDARIDDKPKPAPDAASSASPPPSSSGAAPSSTLYADRQAAAERAKTQARAQLHAGDDLLQVRDPATGFLVSSSAEAAAVVLPGTNNAVADQRAAMGLAEFERVINDDQPLSTKVLSFELAAGRVEDVRRVCNELSYPMLEEYDFSKDNSTPDLPIHLKPAAQIRDYQEKSLSKMFGNGRARSGIIVLPCGAGKTLVGITAAATVKKSTLVFCTTGVAVDQWRRQFLHWSTLPSKYICQFTSSVKDRCTTDSLVLITTYNMVSFSGKRSAAAEEVMSLITTQEWGLVVLDEVHVAPARMFRKCVSITHSRAKLGLTATLVREDNLVDDLFYLIGPKLYEANWLDLQTAGYIATVQCVEVWAAMTPEFYQAYLTASHAKQMLLYVMNPNKLRTCEYLMRLHEARGDKVLVFSDNVFALRYYATQLNKPLIYGATSDAERLEFLHHFQHDPAISTLFISKVGDNSIDLPDVNVIIQISSHFSSRRQEAQRLGRILRPKSAALGRLSDAGHKPHAPHHTHRTPHLLLLLCVLRVRSNAFFYTIVSKDTREMVYATKRQRFLVDQGYAFKVEATQTHDHDLATRRTPAHPCPAVWCASGGDGAERDGVDGRPEDGRQGVAV